jgi:TolB protein
LRFPEFKVLGQTPDNDGLAKLGANVLANDLSISGVFEVLDPKSYLEDAKKGGLTEASVNFNDWLNVGANALIKAGVTIDGENVKLDIRLFDVVTKKMVLGKEYKSVKFSIAT